MERASSVTRLTLTRRRRRKSEFEVEGATRLACDLIFLSRFIASRRIEYMRSKWSSLEVV